VTDALYLPTTDPNVFTATVCTQGPWDPNLQHGGPPSALLTRAVEQADASWPFTVVRLAIEILGPMPIGDVQVESQIARSGRSVELVEAELTAAGRVAAKARAWRIRQADLDLPDIAAVPTDHPPMPSERVAMDHWPSGFLEAMDWRYAVGGWDQRGPGTMWANLLVPLVADEPITALQRLMTLADCGNGVSGVVPLGWKFINPDLTVHVARYPEGEWMCIDLSGRVGHGAQSLFVSPP
jgi:hypothetical protein